MTDADLDLLKTVVEQNYSPAVARKAIKNVLRVLRETPSANEMWRPIYDAVKSAYISESDWGDDDA